MKLQFLSGSIKKEGFKNVDKYNTSADFVCDVMGFNANKDSIEEIYCHHGIEHLTYKEVDIFLGRCFLWLKKGGKLTLIQPDIVGTMKMYPRNAKIIKTLLYGDLKGIGWEHKSGWTKEWLEDSLKKAGFQDIRFSKRRIYEITAVSKKM